MSWTNTSDVSMARGLWLSDFCSLTYCEKENLPENQPCEMKKPECLFARGMQILLVECDDWCYGEVF